MKYPLYFRFIYGMTHSAVTTMSPTPSRGSRADVCVCVCVCIYVYYIHL